ncbi:MAG: YggS family pyridoxal phosphate-dependent enzyme [Thalassobius sp.]|nr:YggS family pyridoxal phosphate-dependent enzyme [Thalassovita sp.]
MNETELIRNLDQIKTELDGTGCKLIAVSKTKPVEILTSAYQAGIRIFGENKVQEMVQKYEALPKDIEWHMIGHLQTNKVKLIAPFVSLIHSVDSIKLLKEINKRAAQNDRIIDCLFQIHIAEEETKFGLDEAELFELIESDEFNSMENIRMKGLMGMATYTTDYEQVRKEFTALKDLFNKTGSKYVADNLDFTEISMGMSNDYRIALKEGSTMIRVGSLIFGERNYNN